MNIIVILWIILFLIGGTIVFLLVHKKTKKTSVQDIPRVQHVNPEVFLQGVSGLMIQQKDILTVKESIQQVIVGMDELIDMLLVALLCNGHILVEGVPGLAKTKTIHTFADTLGLSFKRIQFTPDMLPSDIVGTQIYNPQTRKFTVKPGPIVANVILADEINRTTPKVQSALLEAMQEGQITIDGQTIELPYPFLVLATQNSLEHEGTYPLPEAQIDRFMAKVIVHYPDLDKEKDIIDRALTLAGSVVSVRLTHKKLGELQEKVREVKVSEHMKHYITSLVHSTRQKNPDILYGASPRASIALCQAAQALAFLQGREQVIIDDVHSLALDILRHRLVLHYQAQVSNVHIDNFLAGLLASVPVM